MQKKGNTLQILCEIGGVSLSLVTPTFCRLWLQLFVACNSKRQEDLLLPLNLYLMLRWRISTLAVELVLDAPLEDLYSCRWTCTWCSAGGSLLLPLNMYLMLRWRISTLADEHCTWCSAGGSTLADEHCTWCSAGGPTLAVEHVLDAPLPHCPCPHAPISPLTPKP